MRSYEAARTLYSILGFLAWCCIGLGVLVVIGAGSAASTMARFGGGPSGLTFFVGAAPGILICLGGFIFLANVQDGRASVDCAEYAQQSLQIARDQLEISRQALRQGERLEAGYAVLSSRLAEPHAVKGGFDRLRNDSPEAPAESARATRELDPKLANRAYRFGAQATDADPALLREYQPKGRPDTMSGPPASSPATEVDPTLRLEGMAVAPEPAERSTVLAAAPIVETADLVEFDRGKPNHHYMYKGYKISTFANGFLVRGIGFPNLESAQRFVDNVLTTPRPSSDAPPHAS